MMGIFWEPETDKPSPLIVNNFAEAIRSQPPDNDEAVAAQATQRAQAAASVAQPVTFHVWRLVGALVIVGVLLVAGIVSDANGWTDAEKTLFALATAGFGVVTGLLSGKS
jgi:hypothetical protein